MESLANLIGNVAGVIGVLLCVISGATRLLGQYYVLGQPVDNLFLVGIAGMVLACLAKLYRLDRLLSANRQFGD